MLIDQTSALENIKKLPLKVKFLIAFSTQKPPRESLNHYRLK